MNLEDLWGTPSKLRGKPATFKLEYRSVPVTESGCILWLGSLNASGYGTMYYKGSVQLCHRVAWMERRGEIPENLCVLHKCDTPSCINTDHLFLGTNKDNVNDKVNKGRQLGFPCESNPNSKLTTQDVLAIRNSGLGTYRIAKIYNVAPQTIWRIRTNQGWKL